MELYRRFLVSRDIENYLAWCLEGLGQLAKVAKIRHPGCKYPCNGCLVATND